MAAMTIQCNRVLSADAPTAAAPRNCPANLAGGTHIYRVVAYPESARWIRHIPRLCASIEVAPLHSVRELPERSNAHVCAWMIDTIVREDIFRMVETVRTNLGRIAPIIGVNSTRRDDYSNGLLRANRVDRILHLPFRTAILQHAIMNDQAIHPSISATCLIVTEFRLHAERLKDLARDHLDIVVAGPGEIATIGDIPHLQTILLDLSLGSHRIEHLSNHLTVNFPFVRRIGYRESTDIFRDSNYIANGWIQGTARFPFDEGIFGILRLKNGR